MEYPMIEQTIQVFDEKEEEFLNLLISVGVRKTIARVIVFFASTKEATSREIERGTDLRQPEVSIAIKYLTNQGWINRGKVPSEGKGRPQKKYRLSVKITEIVSSIESQKKSEAKNQLALVRKMREYA